MATLCSSCGYQLDPFDPNCPRCARGLSNVVAVVCSACNKTNPARLYACSECDTRLSTTLDQIPKQPLDTYQRMAQTHLAEGNSRRGIVTLFEACEFYPTVLPLRQHLVEVLRANGHDAVAEKQARILYVGHIQASEEFGIEQASTLFGQGKFPQALDVLQHTVNFHPRSYVAHEWLASCYEASGDPAKGQSERAIAHQLKIEFERQRHMMQQQANANAQAKETAAMNTGTVIGAAGAATGVGITFVSVLAGLGTVLLGVLICLAAFLLCCTCLGIVPGIMLLGTGFATITAGFAVMAGGTAAGAATGAAGVATGSMMGKNASRKRAAREDAQK